ncbi:MAG: AbrB/MazE/SpoVT family DNA-binding domain-containing protein [Halobacteriales archaeon]|nr:AbrB/MazE/SpoVT family DNA-binding domain-containing protein [Halobacteriales archaeon]
MASDFEGELRKWGNSYAVRVPKDVVESEGLREGARVRLLVLRRPRPGAWGALRGWKLDPQAMKDELREEHDW